MAEVESKEKKIYHVIYPVVYVSVSFFFTYFNGIRRFIWNANTRLESMEMVRINEGKSGERTIYGN